MAYFKNDSFLENAWKVLPPGENIFLKGRVLLDRKQWFALRDSVRQLSQPLGLRLEPGTSLAEILPDLHRFELIVLNFPKFSDGRAFSTAHLIRVVHGFKGEIRATGDVLFDQMQLMQRCGIDAFEIVHAPTIRALEAGKRPDITNFYQPGFGPEIPAGTRPWARRRPQDENGAACFSI